MNRLSEHEARQVLTNLDSPRSAQLEARYKASCGEVIRLRTLRDQTPEGPRRNKIRDSMLRQIRQRDHLQQLWNAALAGQ